MRHILLSITLLAATALWGFECTPFGTQMDLLNCARFDDTPLCLGGMEDGHGTVALEVDNLWNYYPHWSTNLPVIDVIKRDDETLMAIMGAGSYSDGVYNLDLSTHVWTLGAWFFRPNFLVRYPVNGVFYIGENDGLFKSTNGTNWTRITSIGLGICNSMAWWENHVVANRGNAVYYSADGAGTWNQSGMTLLQDFRFAMDGTLYGAVNAGLDSDGLWRSLDYGETWEPVFYTTGLCSIGPDFGGLFPLGWDQPNEHGQYLELYNTQGVFTPLDRPELASLVRELDVFPLVNTPSFYVLNGNGCYFLTGFIGSDADDPDLTPAASWEFSIRPNPACGQVWLDLAGKVPAGAEFRLYDLRGRKVFSSGSLSLRGREAELALPALPAGVYLLQAEGGYPAPARKLLLIK